MLPLPPVGLWDAEAVPVPSPWFDFVEELEPELDDVVAEMVEDELIVIVVAAEEVVLARHGYSSASFPDSAASRLAHPQMSIGRRGLLKNVVYLGLKYFGSLKSKFVDEL